MREVPTLRAKNVAKILVALTFLAGCTSSTSAPPSLHLVSIDGQPLPVTLKLTNGAINRSMEMTVTGGAVEVYDGCYWHLQYGSHARISGISYACLRDASGLSVEFDLRVDASDGYEYFAAPHTGVFR
jgi:hypothetical protein